MSLLQLGEQVSVVAKSMLTWRCLCHSREPTGAIVSKQTVQFCPEVCPPPRNSGLLFLWTTATHFSEMMTACKLTCFSILTWHSSVTQFIFVGLYLCRMTSSVGNLPMPSLFHGSSIRLIFVRASFHKPLTRDAESGVFSGVLSFGGCVLFW